MKTIQKVIIIIYCILVAVACIYVPWETWEANFDLIGDGFGNGLAHPISLGYSLLWKPLLEASKSKIKAFYSIVDIRRVTLELIAITAIFAILFVLTLRPKKVLPGS